MKRISIGILTYNHEYFIEQCLKSVLSSNYPNLEIIISDDCSTDATAEVVARTLTDTPTTHHIVFNQNTVNLGIAAHVNKVFGELCTGELMVTLGGDDMIINDYFENASKYFEIDPQLMMIDFNADIIDDKGNLTEKILLPYEHKVFQLEDYVNMQSIHSFAPGRMIKRDIVDCFEPISKYCPTEDSVFVLRALMLGKLMRMNNIVISYRRHGGNVSSVSNLKKMSNARIIAQYLKDVLYLYEKNKIREEVIGGLLNRINFQYHLREATYATKSNLIRPYKLKLMKVWYIIQNRIRK